MACSESDFVFLILTHMEDDGCTFWAQQHSPTIKLDLEHMTSRMEKIASSNPCMIDDPIKGRVYGCKFIDDSWYRCKLLFSISKTKYLVQYIDYGNCEETIQGSLLNVPIDLQESSMPAMAHRFRLHDIFVDHDKVEMVQKCVESMCNDCFVKAHLKTALESPPTEVVLYNDEGRSICDLLLKTGLAKSSSLVEAKANVIMSPPLVSKAQKYRNPLLISSSDDSGDDYNNNIFRKYSPTKVKFTSQSSGFDSMTEGEFDSFSKGDGGRKKKMNTKVQCEFCQENKDELQRMRLSMLKMQQELADNGHKISELEEKEAIWKKKYSEIEGKQIGKETQTEEKQNHVSEEQKKLEDLEIPDQKSDIASPSEQVVTSCSSDEVDNSAVINPTKVSPMKKSANEFVMDANTIMKKVILPTFDFTKKLSSSCKIIDDCRKYYENLREIVANIKLQIDNKVNQNSDGFLSLVAMRNTVLLDLQQTIRSTLPLISLPEDELLKERVHIFMVPLKKLVEDCEMENLDGDIGVSDVNDAIQEWKLNKENFSDISNIVRTLMTCLSNQSKKIFTAGEFLAKVRPIQDSIASLQAQEKIIKDVVDEMKSIKKKKQKIRLHIATLKNLEEDENDASPPEKEALNLEKNQIENELSLLREEIHECFENKWILMESLADMVENFSPELQTEHPELGIKEYIDGKGVMMSDMELDHFNIKGIERNEVLKLEYQLTEYRGQPIMLTKYDSRLMSEPAWDKILTEIAIYTNIEGQNVIAPMGVFIDKDAIYVMLTVPQYPSVLLPRKKGLDKPMAKGILKNIASALNMLRENGIYHGQVTPSSVLVAEQSPHQACLSVPNFMIRSQMNQENTQESIAASLANDVYKFGMLAKVLEEKTEGDAVFEDVVKLCLEKSSDINMQSIIDIL
uniref:serine/threonine-protein kinase 31-like n=1 Tax=Styela clava TaxID=7725 RepID=UPI0019393C8A|nr:serine/threonine-protein kinase 31-like [Styela clava]